MPAPAAKKAAEPAKKKKDPPKELCGCGVDTYRAPPKGKKKLPAPIEHASGCNFQRTTCDSYPSFPRCPVCQDPCKFCAGKNRWCPHCYERQCSLRYKRVIHGWHTPATAGGSADLLGTVTGSASGQKTSKRPTVVTFAGAGRAKSATRKESKVKV